MKRIGIRELKQRASEILREVRDKGASYEVTYRGEVIANLAPAQRQESSLTIEEWNAACDRLAAQIDAATLPEYRNVSSVDLIRYDRDRLDHVLGLPFVPDEKNPGN